MKFLSKFILVFLLSSNIEISFAMLPTPANQTNNYSMQEFAKLSQNVFNHCALKKKMRDNSSLSFANEVILPFREIYPDNFKFMLNFFFVMYFSSLETFGFDDQYIRCGDKRNRDLYLCAIKGLLIVMKLFYAKKSSSLFDLNYLYEIVLFADYPLFVFCMDEFFYVDYKAIIINEIYKLSSENNGIFGTLRDVAMFLFYSPAHKYLKLQYKEIECYLSRNNGVSLLFPQQQYYY